MRDVSGCIGYVFKRLMEASSNYTVYMYECLVYGLIINN